MKVLITGANGFIGKNLRFFLSERGGTEIVCFTRENSVRELESLLLGCEFVFHLAGVNRPQNAEEFVTGNRNLTEILCEAILATGRCIPVLYVSSAQAVNDTLYGRSKLAAEQKLVDFSVSTACPVYIFRLPNVFGKWAKPNYNSVVATFCHNIAHDLPIKINDPNVQLSLVYIDDVIESFISIIDGEGIHDVFCRVGTEYSATVGELVETIQGFKNCRESQVIDAVGTGLIRALYSTYVSYLPVDSFAYSLRKHEDARGVFVEMLKTKDSGQFSYFTAHPSVTRGGHYHHSKTEKFLVLKGNALFRFKNILNNEYYEIKTNGEDPMVVETVPGWTHDITNIGTEEMLVMLWANEIFNPERSDTIACKI